MKLALLGFGTVGQAAARLLLDVPEITVTHVLNRHVARKRVDWLPSPVTWTEDIDDVLAARPDIVVELVGGRDPAGTWVRRALEAGAHVVTANKQLIAHEGDALLQLAAARGRHLAFVASGDRTVDIIDTQRFTRVGRLYIRDVVTGPLRAVLPFPADNAGNTCATMPITDRAGRFVGDAIQIYEGGSFNTPIAPDGITDDRCIVMKLFATTSGGGVVVIDVRKADVFREHPARR